MTTSNLRLNPDIIIAAKRQQLLERQAKTPIVALRALAEMQRRPHPLLNTVPSGNRVMLIGQIRRSDPYDPVTTALRFIREGADGITLFTDHMIYPHDLDDILLITRGVKEKPVILQNYVLDDYQVVEARSVNVSGLVLYASVLTDDTLRKVVTATQINRMSVIIQIEDEEQLAQAHQLSPHAIGIGVRPPDDNKTALVRLESLRPSIPFNMRVMLMCSLDTLEEVEAAVALGVDAVIVSENLLTKQYSGQLRQLLERAE